MDENKREAVRTAAISLINAVGFADTSVAKIAKKAKVSPGTIYIYFKNKEDMLNKLYLMVKKNFGDAVLQGFNPKAPIKRGVKLVFENMCDFFEKNPEQFLFMEQFASSPLVNKVSREAATQYYLPIIELLERGKKEKTLKNVSIEIMGSYCFNPIAHMLKLNHQEKKKLRKPERDAMFEMTWGAIKA